MGSEEETTSLKVQDERYASSTLYELYASLLVVVGYVLLSGELCVLVRSEHVIPVPGDTVVVGDKVGVKSA